MSTEEEFLRLLKKVMVCGNCKYGYSMYDAEYIECAMHGYNEYHVNDSCYKWQPKKNREGAGK